ncbi:MAG: cation:dicarboxylate symporter family transporter, partial [Sphingobacterium sp.]
MKSKFAVIFTISTLSLAALLYTLDFIFNVVPENLLFFSRWLAVLGLILYGLRKRTLTTWILISLVIGASVGHDWPQVGISMQVASKAFLKLIKTIVSPLIFATLVYGIAGHSDIKQVGRMGWKSLLYFEVVTTIALFIGLAAINISKAGMGIIP